MSIKNKIMLVASSLFAVVAAALPFAASAADDFTTPSDATAVVSTFTTNIGTILHGSLPTILVVVASLLGISILIRWTKRHVK